MKITPKECETVWEEQEELIKKVLGEKFKNICFVLRDYGNEFEVGYTQKLYCIKGKK